MPTICRSLEELATVLGGRRSVMTVGNFDGVHRGHMTVIDETARVAQAREAASVVITFDGHPAAVFGHPTPPLITSTVEKLRYLSESDVDAILLLSFTSELGSQTMESFVRPLMEQAGLETMVLGYDSRFGSDAWSDPVDLFDQKMEALGVPVRRVEPLRLGGTEVSSSRIRPLLREGRLAEAEELLGHTYSLYGVVTAGRQIGRTMGYPTANILPDGSGPLIPRDAIFAAEVVLDGVTYPSMAYYGTAPTIAPDDRDYRIEAYLLDFSGDLYGDRVEIAFRSLLRGDKRFDTLEELTAQLELDEASTRDYFHTHTTLLRGAEPSL